MSPEETPIRLLDMPPFSWSLLAPRGSALIREDRCSGEVIELSSMTWSPILPLTWRPLMQPAGTMLFAADTGLKGASDVRDDDLACSSELDLVRGVSPRITDPAGWPMRPEETPTRFTGLTTARWLLSLLLLVPLRLDTIGEEGPRHLTLG